ncbi:MAG: hypothetical protein OEW48_13700 [Phycisphaerae bacterium]|nr:hypothetical protein [Phycisphaerae bacterium]
MPKVSSETPFPPEQKTALSGPEKKPTCRGVASGEDGTCRGVASGEAGCADGADDPDT